MSAPVKTYRVYCFDGARHVVSVDEIEAASDAEAIASAHAQGFGDKCEIWDGKRLVAQLTAEPRRAWASPAASGAEPSPSLQA